MHGSVVRRHLILVHKAGAGADWKMRRPRVDLIIQFSEGYDGYRITGHLGTGFIDRATKFRERINSDPASTL